MNSKLELNYIGGEIAYANMPLDLAIYLGVNSTYYGPSNLTWKKQVDFTSPLEYLGKDELKRVLKGKEYAEQVSGITINLNESIIKEEFIEWVPLYRKNIDSKNIGVPWIDESWYDKQSQKALSKYGSIIIKDSSNKVIGGAFVSKSSKNNSISCDFRAHEYIKYKDTSLSAIIEYSLDAYALKYGFSLITRGTDENLYGLKLSTGLYEFKKHYHFNPYALDTHGSYYPRVTIFFKEYSNLLTLSYISNDKNNGIEPQFIEKTELTPLAKIMVK